MNATRMAGIRCETMDEPRIARRTGGNVVGLGGASPKRSRASLSRRSVLRKSIRQFARAVKRSQLAAGSALSRRTSLFQSALFGSHQRSDADIQNPTQINPKNSARSDATPRRRSRSAEHAFDRLRLARAAVSIMAPIHHLGAM